MFVVRVPATSDGRGAFRYAALLCLFLCSLLDVALLLGLDVDAFSQSAVGIGFNSLKFSFKINSKIAQFTMIHKNYFVKLTKVKVGEKYVVATIEFLYGNKLINYFNKMSQVLIKN